MSAIICLTECIQKAHSHHTQSDNSQMLQQGNNCCHLLKLMDRLRLSIEVMVPGLLIWHLLAMMLLCHCIWHLMCTKQCLRGFRLILMLMLRAGQLLHCLLELPTGLKGRAWGSKGRLTTGLQGRGMGSQGRLPTGLKGRARGSQGRQPTGLQGRARGSKGRLPTGLQGRVGGSKGRLMQMLKSGHWLPSLLGLPTTLGGKVGLKGRLPNKLRGRAEG